MAKNGKDYEAALHDQTNILPQRELIFVFCIMALSLCVCFIDQNSIAVLLPDIARDLHAESTISWAGTSALIANTVFQVLYGRLSDLFGRKIVLLSALVLLSISDLLCGLSQNATMLYVFRALSGVANGGIMSLTMMIVSDVVTLQQRGKYQGILGTMVGMGNATGPLIAAGFAKHATWRGLYYMLAPLILCAATASWKYLPSTMPKQSFKDTVKKVDFLGLIFGSAAIILILIPVSDGGHGMSWSSPTSIAMLTVGGICAIAFVLAEYRFAKLPMMPLSMFRTPSVAVMLLQSFLIGASYYSYLYYLPLYYQLVHGYSILDAALLMLPLVITQSTFSVLCGLYLSTQNRYLETLYFGFGIWTLGAGLLITCDATTSPARISGFLVLMGTGTGCVFQPTLVALQAHCAKSQRAVVTSNRNFLRSLGGAVGLAVSSALMGNVLKSALPARLSAVAKNTFSTPDLSTYSEADRQIIRLAYASASRAVFIWCTPLMGLCLLGCVVIRDKGLQRQEEKVGQTPAATGQEVRAGDGEDAEKRAVTTEAVDEKPSEAGSDGEVALDVPALSSNVHDAEQSRKPSVSSEKSAKSEA